MAANRLAKGSRFWGRYLEQANSGTGSKQWLIVDYGQIMGLDAVNSLHVDKKVASKLLSNLQPKQQNAVKKARAPVGVKRGLLWVVEQTPEHVHYADQTRMLQQTGFWVSDGHPYYQVLCFLLLITLHVEERTWTEWWMAPGAFLNMKFDKKKF